MRASHLAHNSEPGVEVSESPWREGGAAGGELKEGLALLTAQLHQDVHQPQERGRVAAVTRQAGALVAALHSGDLGEILK